MPNIKIIDNPKKPYCPSSRELSTEQPRYKNTGKPPLPLDKSFSPQAKKQSRTK